MPDQRTSQLWEEGLEVLKEMKLLGAQSYFESLPAFADLLKLRDHSLRCIDEGTPGGVHLAGSGILMNLDAAKKALAKAKIDGIYSHEECGAAKMFAQAEGLDISQADEVCKEWAETLSAETDVPYKGHLTIDKMERPAGFHRALVIYYDGTGKFNNAAPGVPSGFVISRKFLELDYAKKELEVAVGIAFGSHGFGQRFTTENPFRVIAVTNADGVKMDKLIGEISGSLSGYNGRAAADSLLL